jgi:DUF2934 family protein
MAKAKDAKERSSTNGTKSAGSRTPGSRPLQARKPTKAAPDTAEVRSPERESSGNTQPKLSPEDVYKLIQESAYFKAKARGFAPGHEVQDWIEAEQEVRQRLDGRV